MPFITLCYHFVNNVQNTFSFELARHWMKERGISCMALSVEFIYLTALGARKWIKRTRNINAFYTTVGDNELAYAGVQIRLRRRVHQ